MGLIFSPKSLEVTRNTSVAEFAKMIEKLYDIPTNKLTFSAEGKMFSCQMCPDKRLSDLGIKENTIISFVYRCLGMWFVNGWRSKFFEHIDLLFVSLLTFT